MMKNLLVLFASFALIAMIGCDDSNTINQIKINDLYMNTIITDQAITITEPPPPVDMAPIVDMRPVMDMAVVTRPDMMVVTPPACTQGDIRLVNGCGYERCDANGQWVVPSMRREFCNNHDDDCDQKTDENFNIGGFCSNTDMTTMCTKKGTLACNAQGQTECVLSGTGMEAEVCDGIDNDCDSNTDEGFPESPKCCSESLHCPSGQRCVDHICTVPVVEMPDYGMPPADMGMSNQPNVQGVGTCASPVALSGFGEFIANGDMAQKKASINDCTGNSDSDGLITLQTLLGSEMIFSVSFPQNQRITVSSSWTPFDNVLSVGSCSDNFLGITEISSLACDEAEPLSLSAATVTLDVLANQTYYIILDTTLDISELSRIFGNDFGYLPFVISIQPAN